MLKPINSLSVDLFPLLAQGYRVMVRAMQDGPVKYIFSKNGRLYAWNYANPRSGTQPQMVHYVTEADIKRMFFDTVCYIEYILEEDADD